MIWTAVRVLTLIFLMASGMSGCDQMAEATTAEATRIQAEATIGEALTLRGAQFTGLPDTNMAAVGPLAFLYQPQNKTIAVSVLIAEFTAWTLFPDRRPKLEQTVTALQNPAIGGRFQTDGATWMFDRNTGKLTLGYTFAATVDVNQLSDGAESLERLYPDWSLHWMGAVADIVHEDAAIPAQNVTIENNPYR